MTSNAIKVNTRQFRKVHGHDPRGRFLWTFRYSGMRFWFTMRGEYEDCLTAAIVSAEAKGVVSLSVSSVVYGQDPGR